MNGRTWRCGSEPCLYGRGRACCPEGRLPSPSLKSARLVALASFDPPAAAAVPLRGPSKALTQSTTTMTLERPMFPPRAESVDSLTTQPAPEERWSGGRISESRKPIEGLSRRRMLGALAVLPTALPAAAVTLDDPVFELIEAHRVAGAAHAAAIRDADRLGGFRWGHITEKPCHDENEAFEALVRAAATTQPGLLAKLAYLREIAESDEAWMLDEREGTALNLMKSFAGSLHAIWGVRQ